MSQKLHFSSCLSDEIINEILNISPGTKRAINKLESAIFSFKNNSSSETFENLFSKDIDVSKRYFRIYTLPLLETCNLLSEKRFNEALLWSKINLSFCLNLRFLDNVIDDDVEAGDNKYTVKLSNLKKADNYLTYALKLLYENGFDWQDENVNVYNQFYEYERESYLGHFYEFDTLWRRVSPLCILMETYLKDRIVDKNFINGFQKYLSCLLITADMDDFFEDFRNKKKTPVTKFILENKTDDFKQLFMSQRRIEELCKIVIWNIDNLINGFQERNKCMTIVLNKLKIKYTF